MTEESRYALFDSPSSGSEFWYREVATDLAGENVGYLRMAGDRLHRAGGWVAPERVARSFPLEVAAMPPQMAEEITALQPTVTFS